MPDIKFPIKVTSKATATNTPKKPDPKKEG